MKRVVRLLTSVFFASAIMGMACKLLTLLDTSFYFPAWPNIVDVATLMLAALYFLDREIRR